MAELLQDGVIQYATVKEFLDDYNLHIRKGGLLVKTRATWNQREGYPFSITVAGVSKQVSFRAEVVYAAAGQVGLQILSAPEVLERMEDFVRSLSAPEKPAPRSADPAPATDPSEPAELPRLQEDGSILYPSREAFLADCDGSLQQGGLFVSTPVDLSVRDVRKYELRILGVDKSLEVEAEVVFSKDGRTGLNMAGDPAFASKVVRFASVVRTAGPSQPEPKSAVAAAGPASLPELVDGGTVLYTSPDDFVAAADSELRQGKLSAASDRDLKVGAVLPFVLRIQGMDLWVEFDAEIAGSGGGRLAIRAVDGPGFAKKIQHFASAFRPSSPGEKATEMTDVDVSGTLLATLDLNAFGVMEPVPLSSLHTRDLPLPALLASIDAAGMAVALVVIHKRAEHVFRFNAKGNLVQYEGPDSGDKLLERLADGRLITRTQQASVSEEAKSGKSVEAILVEHKFVQFRDLWIAIRDQVVDAFASFMGADGVPFKLGSIKTGRKSGVPTGHLLVPLMTLVLEQTGDNEVRRRLDPHWRTYPIARGDARFQPANLVMSRKQRTFVDEYLDGKRTLSDAVDVFPLYHRDEAKSIFVILEALGSLDLRSTPLGEVAKDPETELAELIEALEKKDPFVQAGVHWSSHPSEYDPGLEKLRREFGPEGEVAGISERARKMCARRLEMAQRAHNDIKKPSLRKSFRERYVGSYQLRTSVDLLYKQADLHIMKQEYKKALQLIEVALEIHPRNEYVAKLQKLKAVKD